MSERAGGSRRRTWGAVAAAGLAVLVAGALVWPRAAPAPVAPVPPVPVVQAVAPAVAVPAAPPAPAWDVAGRAAPALPAAAPPVEPPPPARVDLAALRARLPDNVFWELGAPTADAQVLARRAAHTAERAALGGRVEAGEASEAEVHAYFEARRRLSEDFLAVALAVLETYGEGLSEQERGLYALSARMHRTRLDAIDRDLAEALERTRAQAARRAAWRSGQGP